MKRRLERALHIVTRMNLFVHLLAGALLVVLVNVTFLSGSGVPVEGAMSPLWLRVAVALGVTLLWGAVAFMVIRQRRRGWLEKKTPQP